MPRLLASWRYFLVLDFDLQMRFFKSTNDAFVEFASAALASVAHAQEQMAQLITEPGHASASAGINVFSPWSCWLDMSALMRQPPFGASAPQFGSEMFPFSQMMMPPLAPITQFWSAFAPAPSFSNGFGTAPQAFDFGVTDMMRTYFGAPAFSWTMYQWPWTMMLISAGMPQSVASPTARCSAATLDAVDAAREQMTKMFSAYRSEGGHASTQALQGPAMMMDAMMPWMKPFISPFIG